MPSPQFNTFVAGHILTASEMNSYLMKQSVIVCDSSADYPGSPVEGMVIFDKALNRGLFYTGAAWLPSFGSMPGCKALLSTTMSNTANGADIPVALDDTDAWDTDAFHDPASNNTKITIPTGLGGRYIIVGKISWESDSTARRTARIKLNDTSSYGFTASSAETGTHGVLTTAEIELVATDYVELIGQQNTGGTLDITGGDLSVRWVSGPDPD